MKLLQTADEVIVASPRAQSPLHESETMEPTAEELALRAAIESNPVLLRLYLAAKRLAAVHFRRELWANTAWALTPTATPTPRPVLPPLPWHTRPSADPQVTAIQQLAEADARREVESDPTGEPSPGP